MIDSIVLIIGDLVGHKYDTTRKMCVKLNLEAHSQLRSSMTYIHKSIFSP